MKKTISILLAVMMSLSLAACGTKEVSTINNANESIENTIETATDISVEVSSAETHDQEEVEETYRLKELFAEHGMKVGTCLSMNMLANLDQRLIVTDQFNSITMENSMKPDYIFNKDKSIETGDLVVEFNNEVIKMLDFARKNNMAVRGHTIIWHSQTPNWIFYEDFKNPNKFASREVMLTRMESYIKQIFEQLDELGYTDLFYAYDVVNEAWMEDGSMRQSFWLSTIGDDYLWYAFSFADKYAPESIDLYYNDYNEQMKTNTLIKFVETLKDENGNYLIDGIGFQAHLYTSDNLENYFRNLDSIAELGLKIQLTELDVCLGAYQSPQKADEMHLMSQGRFYYDLINGIFERVDNGQVKMDALTFWGVSDVSSWRSEYSPLLYSLVFKPKYAYYGAMQIREKAGFNN